MKQHAEIKARYPDAVLLFRVGDFYETFGEDAIIASRVLGITLTKRANGSASHIELAGFPHHSVDTDRLKPPRFQGMLCHSVVGFTLAFRLPLFTSNGRVKPATTLVNL